MAVKALFFDLDGTIADTHAIHLANWLEVLRPHGIDVDMDLYKEKLSGRSNEEVINELLPDLSSEEQTELLEREADGYRGRMAESGAIAGLHRLLDEARSCGLEIALVSNAPKEDAQDSLESLGLSDSFKTMVFAEDVGAQKPDPAPYETALDKLGISAEEALTFEDSPSGVSGAVAAGIPVVGISSTTHSPDELSRSGVRRRRLRRPSPLRKD